MPSKKKGEEPQQQYDLKGFHGAVILNDWLALPSSQKVQGLVGKISFYSAKEFTGHDVVTARNANWLLLVEGAKERFTILGCQVRAVITNPQQVQNPDYYEVQ